MVTVLGVIFNVIWIIGLAGLLATLSYTDWQRKQLRQSWKSALSVPSFTVAANLSLSMVAIGVGLSGWHGTPAQPLWQTVLWMILAFLFLFQAIVATIAGKATG